MNEVNRQIFRAIFEDKWLSIEYKNKKNEITHYWIGIQSISLRSNPMLHVDSLHLGVGTVMEIDIYVASIQKASVIDGSYYEVPRQLKNDIELNRSKYQVLFEHVDNLKILNYLNECNKLDTTPYKTEFAYINHLDNDIIGDGQYQLTNEQFMEIVRAFQASQKQKNNLQYKQLVLNILSINTKQGLYVLAYRKLNLDVKKRCFRQDDDITVCQQFVVDNKTELSIRYFLDEEDYFLIEDIEDNLELIKDIIGRNGEQVDDNPYVIAIGRDVKVDLDKQYQAITEQMTSENPSYPLRAFFGQLVRPVQRYKDYPITLLDSRVNLDQLLAVYHGVKYPLTYVQGPPGSGKTSTIINTILTAYYNNKTLLFASYNNHPIDSVFKQLSTMKYHDEIIPFPILRLGNQEKNLEALKYMKNLYENCKDEFLLEDEALELNSSNKELTDLMKKYEEILELKERKETIEKLLAENQDNFQLTMNLQVQQLNEVEQRLKELGEVNNQQALSFAVDSEDFRNYLYTSGIQRIQTLEQKKYEELRGIFDVSDEKEALTAFNKYLSNDSNLKKLLKVFPIIATTCISASRLGSPKQHFDLTIIDEASQCNTAASLIPILRGDNLMLVGDPNQLSPVIVLDKATNERLKKKYAISEEYDYCTNSIYKTYLAADSLSREILLSHHYRCHKDIIGFCNHKYYNDQLQIDSKSLEQAPLEYIDLPASSSEEKNCAPDEVNEIIKYIKENPDQSIGVITPFVKQKNLINDQLKQNGINNVTCGTVHAFQGDEKDVILFSTALTNKTTARTYQWVKNNKELLNVAVSRAKNKLVMLTNNQELQRLHIQSKDDQNDDMYELAQYIKNKGNYQVKQIQTNSRALGIKPYSTETEDAFMTTLSHALSNITQMENSCTIKKEVAVAHVFTGNPSYSDLFYSGRFDFVVYQKDYRGKEMPILAIELDGKEHYSDEVVKARDQKKNQICRDHGFELIRVENSYARRYNYIKDILIDYFSKS